MNNNERRELKAYRQHFGDCMVALQKALAEKLEDTE